MSNKPTPLSFTETDQPVAEEESILPENDPDFRWLMPNPIYCDYYTAQKFRNGIVRISFGEYFGRDYRVLYRQSVAMPFEDVKRLHRSLGRLIEKHEGEKDTHYEDEEE